MLSGVPAGGRGAGPGKKLTEVAQHWARGRLTTEDAQAADHEQRDAALAAYGLVLEGSAPALPEFHLWSENWLPLRLWFAGQSCLRRGMQGPEGLDYAALQAMVASTRCVRLPSSPRRRGAVWADLRVIEVAVLAEWAVMRDQQAR